MVISDSRLLPVCRLCMGEVDGPRLRRCVGVAASMLFYGLKRDEVNPALEAMGEPPLPDHPDLRVWCGSCAERILRLAVDGQGVGDACAMCRRRVGEETEPGCRIEWLGPSPLPLCLDCRAHVYFRERS